MIPRAEITKLSREMGLEGSQMEKDYVLGWILAAISEHEKLSKSWVLKGETCIRKCFFEDYRFSEDLDFTITHEADLEIIQIAVSHIASWVYRRTDIEIDVSRSIFESIKNPANQLILQGRIFYRGPASPISPRAWPRIKLDITSDELLVNPIEQHKIIHPYSDNSQIEGYRVSTYSFYDLFAEKIRALFERTRPRDLYDVVEIVKRFPSLDHGITQRTLREKCLYKNMQSLEFKSLKLGACEAGWKDQLFHQLQELPRFEEYLESLRNIYNDLEIARILD